MGFAGNLRTVSLPDIFQLIFSTKKTGVLVITKGEGRKDIYFRGGFTIFATSTEEKDLFGNLLLKMGRISKNDLEKVLREKKDGKKIGAALVEMKLFTREEIIDCLRMQIEEIIYGLFGWKDGEFNFIEGKAPPPETIQTELNPMNIIMEGTRRIDEWVELQKVLPPDEAILELDKNPLLSADQIKLSRNEIIVMACIGSGKKLRDVLADSLLDQFLTSKSLANLLHIGLVRVSNVIIQKKVEVDETEDLVRLLANVYRHNFGIIMTSLKDKMGVKGERLYYEAFQERKADYPILAENMTGRDGEIDFELLLKLARSMPKEAWVHRLIANLNDLMTDYLMVIQKYLGNKLYQRTLSQIKIQTHNDLSSRKQLAMKYGLEDELARTLRGNSE